MDKYQLIKVLDDNKNQSINSPPTSAGVSPVNRNDENVLTTAPPPSDLKGENVDVSLSKSPLFISKKKILDTLAPSLREKGKKLLNLLPSSTPFDNTSVIFEGGILSTPVGMIIDYLINPKRKDRPVDTDMFLNLLSPVSIVKKLVPKSKILKPKRFKVTNFKQKPKRLSKVKKSIKKNTRKTISKRKNVKKF